MSIEAPTATPSTAPLRARWRAFAGGWSRLLQRLEDRTPAIAPTVEGFAAAAAIAGLIAPFVLQEIVDTAARANTAAALYLTLSFAGCILVEAILRRCQVYADQVETARQQASSGAIVRLRIDHAAAALAFGLLLGWSGAIALVPIGAGIIVWVLARPVFLAQSEAVRTVHTADKRAAATLESALVRLPDVKAMSIETAFARTIERMHAMTTAARMRSIAHDDRAIFSIAQDGVLLIGAVLAARAVADGHLSLGAAAACLLLSARVTYVLTRIALAQANRP